ncbi:MULTISPECIES: D-alanyl-D-alanine carboxypeptidase family protein [unclassified Wenzhouxiangella]|uniref:D-alanyl-D-alanine carboxypeptidase family protein n=1 Tax=unclassified Wenzhouxiangella TaxID=2613841 RepID=UPI000E32BF0F|nr:MULTISPECIES: D-alanyl-D-alanine carboxypeptidase family protein [unclassified Wenzhouxiangella]RFF27328.1 D-alanyl-D-alanine carboxypeptidase [Wenzhouxiangella sp. 15181]RFP68761.1 D-alanyl-D-alanine carboxypeptidase [Wenzhouxiangella sp. 15190]
MNPVPRIAQSILLAGLLLAGGPLANAQSPVPAAPSVGATSYVLVDFHSDTVIAEREPDARVEPASITKIMTSYVVFSEIAEGNLSLSDEVLISEKAWRTEGSRMFIEVGTRVTVEELLKGVIIQSGNDASVALAEHVGGSEEVFAEMMNEAARNLDMSGTHYVNATGLPHEEQYTTARDVARLADALISRFPDFYAWYSEREYTYSGIRQHNRNRLLWRDPSVDGLKTGHTESAGYCLVTSAMRDGMRLISVVMGTDSEDARATASQALLNYGFRFFETYQLYAADDEISVEPIWKGEADEVSLGVDRDLFVTIPRGRYDALEARLEVEGTLTAPLAEGEQAGRVVVSLDDNDLADRPLVALDGVEQAGFFGRSIDGFRMWVGGLFGGD